MRQVTPLPQELKETLKAISYNTLQALQTPTELQKSVAFIFSLEDFCPSSGQSQVFCNFWELSRSGPQVVQLQAMFNS